MQKVSITLCLVKSQFLENFVYINTKILAIRLDTSKNFRRRFLFVCIPNINVEHFCLKYFFFFQKACSVESLIINSLARMRFILRKISKKQ